jgi:hypothetical protein
MQVKFQRDIAAALDHDPPRQLVEMKRLIGGDHMLDALDHAAVVRRPAGCDQDMLCRDGLAGSKPQRVGVLEHRAF